MELISLKNVGFSYAYAEKPALRGITLDIEPGKLYGVIGPNGSGKSTLCSVIRGTIPHFHPGELSGDVLIYGRDTVDWDPAELSNRIGYVFQNPFTQISGIKDTVFEEIALGLENLGVEREELIDRVRAVIDQVGIDKLVDKDPNQLSGGQRQLVAFASIIAMDADFIVIDEPTSQLDPEASEAVFGIIESLKAGGKTIVLVEHKIDLLAEYADELIVMKRGEVLAHGPARDVLVSEELAVAEIPRPEVTELGLALERAGKPLSSIPITRAEARELVAARMQEA
ncbi:energy-coupling factor ABC transporter ATP-binding protein [Spelaeicoccus albus]|uniref:Energy-coupling factor transport system ATP-binding protein n=1 Tax=Spelaeicoccus albus TaxID=1280376 RepID=A0A7Z0ACH3_9MICO|nr:ABC transporter ATP-binding protein [Spelaeicoccus albus]NYI67213.1 energy-coupling factor transport system ATP-binding protein [Spelaeicoccus albus]